MPLLFWKFLYILRRNFMLISPGTTIWLITVTISSRVVLFAGLDFISIISLGLLDSSTA